MALIGKIEEYNENDSWIEYTERLEQYFAANEIRTTTRNGRFCSVYVERKLTIKLIRNLVNPRKPTDKSFGELVILVKNHLNPRPSSIVYRFMFNSRFRQRGETIQQYVAELRNLSEHCECGDQLEKMLRGRLVCGVNDERIQRRLLEESQLEFKKAMELATAMETADRDTRDLKNGNLTEKPEETQVNRVTKDPPKRPPRIRNNRQKNVIVVEEDSTNPTSAGVKTKSATNAVRRVTRQANLSVSVNRGFERAANLEIHITWRQQTRRVRKNAKNTRCFT